MKYIQLPNLILFLSVALTASIPAYSVEQNIQVCNKDSHFIKRRLSGNQQDNICDTYMGKVMLIVNTASRCAYTDQYDGLEKLYANYKQRGLVVLGFPSNDFGGQEPGNEKTIKEFCRLTYGVEFPMYEKTKIKGDNADSFYMALAKAANQHPKWNFHKYLLNRKGELIGSYNSSVKPGNKHLLNTIEQALQNDVVTRNKISGALKQ